MNLKAVTVIAAMPLCFALTACGESSQSDTPVTTQDLREVVGSIDATWLQSSNLNTPDYVQCLRPIVDAAEEGKTSTDVARVEADYSQFLAAAKAVADLPSDSDPGVMNDALPPFFEAYVALYTDSGDGSSTFIGWAKSQDPAAAASCESLIDTSA